ERVLQALVVRLDDEERLVPTDRVVEPGQALAGREVGALRRGVGLLLGGDDLRAGRAGRTAQPGRPARSRGARGTGEWFVRTPRRPQGGDCRGERSEWRYSSA